MVPLYLEKIKDGGISDTARGRARFEDQAANSYYAIAILHFSKIILHQRAKIRAAVHTFHKELAGL